ncbi:MAG: hypothetical protein CM15mP74_05220 [Halieaceae bacterium]|nr:MAG: hypothetical protein CM15mP74_05220 [Halieaceae bacterium]
MSVLSAASAWLLLSAAQHRTMGVFSEYVHGVSFSLLFCFGFGVWGCA